MVVIAVFAAVVVAPLGNADQESRTSAALHTVKMIRDQLLRHHDVNGAWPATIDPAWFRYQKLPVNPFVPGHRNTVLSDVDGSNNAAKWHPDDKTTRTHPFWYNRLNGAFRIRVPVQATDAETLRLYNAANGVELPAGTRVR